MNDDNIYDNNIYNSSDVNFNVILSNPDLRINDSMSVNIKDNLNKNNQSELVLFNNQIEKDNKLINIDSNVNDDMENNLLDSSDNVNVDEYIKQNVISSYYNDANVIDNEIKKELFVEKKDLKSLIKKDNNSNNNSNYYYREYDVKKKKKNTDYSELKFVFLATLVIFIIIMFFPKISEIISKLFYN